ncbi:hypothetical protein M2419_002256 [Sphingobacterium sp. BIGb0116]|nr:hypothetical protein [Sphingobacterium sp. BIGb0116]
MDIKKHYTNAEQEDRTLNIQLLVTMICILGLLIIAAVLLKPDKPMSCEEFKKMETIDPRIPNWTSNPMFISPCDSISIKLNKQ